MSKTIDVNLRFNADTKAAAQQLNTLKTTLHSLGSTEIKVDGGSLDTAVRSAQTLFDSLQQATDVQTGKLDFTKLNESLKKSNTSLKETSQQLLNLGPQGQKAYTQLATAIAQSEDSIHRLSKRTQDFINLMINNISWNISNTLLDGVAQFVNDGINYIEKLDKSLTDIRIVTGRSTEDMAKFAVQANEAARALKTTTTEYSNASLIYFQQGLGDQEVKERTDATVKMAKVTGDSVTEVSNQLTSIWNNFDDGTKSLEYYVDVVTALGAETASSTDEIAQGLEKFSAVADTVGLSYEYATAALATVTSETRQSAEVVGTAFKTLLSRIQDLELGKTLDDGTTMGTYSKALDKVGISIKDQNGELKTMDKILDEMGEKWQHLSKDQQVALAQAVGGVRQYGQLISLMENWDKVQKNVDVARNSEGTLNEQFDSYKDSMQALDDELQNVKESLYKEIFNEENLKAFKQGLIDIMEFLERFLKSIGGLKGLLTFGGMFALQALLPKLISGVKSLGKSAKDAFGFTRKEKIAELEEMSNNLRNIAGKPVDSKDSDSDKGKPKDPSSGPSPSSGPVPSTPNPTSPAAPQNNNTGDNDTSSVKLTVEEQAMRQNAENASVLVDKRKEYLLVENKLTEAQKEQYQLYLNTLGQKEEAVRLANDEWAAAEEALKVEKEKAKLAEVAAARDTAKKGKELADKKADIDTKDKRIKQDIDDLDKEEQTLKDKKDPKSKERLAEIARERKKLQRDKEDNDTAREKNNEERRNFAALSKPESTAVGQFQKEREQAGKEDSTVSAANSILKKEFQGEGQALEGVQFPEASVENMEKISNLQAKYTEDASKANQLAQTFTNLSSKGATSIKNNKKQQEALNKDLTSAKNLISKYPDAFDESDKEIKDIEKLIEKVNKGVDLTEDEYKQVEKVIKRVQKVTTELRDETAGMGDAMIEDATARGQGNDAYANSLIAVRDRTLEAAGATNNLENAQRDFNVERDKPPVQADPLGKIVETTQQAVQGLTQVATGVASIGASWNTIFAEGASGAEKVGGAIGVLTGVVMVAGGALAVVGAIQKANQAIEKRNIELKKQNKEVTEKNTWAILTEAVASMVGAEATKGFGAALIAVAVGAGIVATVMGISAGMKAKAAKEEEELAKKTAEAAEEQEKQAKSAKEAAEAAREEAEQISQLNKEYQELYEKYKKGIAGTSTMTEKANQLAEALKNENIQLMIQRGEWDKIAELMGTVAEEKDAEAVKRTQQAEDEAIASMALNYTGADRTKGMVFGSTADGKYEDKFIVELGSSNGEDGDIDRLFWTQISSGKQKGYGWEAVRDKKNYVLVYTGNGGSGNPAQDWEKLYGDFYDWIEAQNFSQHQKNESEMYVKGTSLRDDQYYQNALQTGEAADELYMSQRFETAQPTNKSYDEYEKWYEEQKAYLEEQGVGETEFIDYLLKDDDYKYYEKIRQGIENGTIDGKALAYIKNNFTELINKYGIKTVYAYADKLKLFSGSLNDYDNIGNLFSQITGTIENQSKVNNQLSYDEAIDFLENYDYGEDFNYQEFINRFPAIEDLFGAEEPTYQNDPGRLATEITEKIRSNNSSFTFYQPTASSSGGGDVGSTMAHAPTKFANPIYNLFGATNGLKGFNLKDLGQKLAGAIVPTVTTFFNQQDPELYNLKVESNDQYIDKQKEGLKIKYTSPRTEGGGWAIPLDMNGGIIEMDYQGFNNAEIQAFESVTSRIGLLDSEYYEPIGKTDATEGDMLGYFYTEAIKRHEKENKSLYQILTEMNKEEENDIWNTIGIKKEDVELGVGDVKQIYFDAYEAAVQSYGFETVDAFQTAIDDVGATEIESIQDYVTSKINEIKDNETLYGYYEYIQDREDAEVEYYQVLSESVAEYAEHLRSVIPALEDNIDLSKELAEEYLVNQKAIESLTTVWGEYGDILKNPDAKFTPEYGQGKKVIKQDLATIAGLSAAEISDEDIDELISNGILENLINTGNMAEVREYFVNKTFGGIFKDMPEELSTPIQDLIKKLSDEAPSLEIGATIDSSAYMQTLLDMLVQAGFTADGIQAILDQLGWRGKLEYVSLGDTQEINSELYKDGELIGKVVSKNETTGQALIMRPYDTTLDKNGNKIGKYNNLSFSGNKIQSTKNKSDGGGGGKQKKKLEDEIERYHEITREIEEMERVLQRLEKAKDRAFGANKLVLFDQQILETEKGLENYEKELKEINDYLLTDMSNLMSWGFEIDPFTGLVTNYEEIKSQKVEEYNSGKMNEETYEKMNKDLAQYEETIDLLKEKSDALIDKKNELFSLRLEKIQYQIDLKVQVNDNELSYLEYQLNKLENNSFATAESIALMGKQAATNLETMETYQQGIREILKLTLSEEEINKAIAGDHEVLKNNEFTQEQIDKLNELKESVQEAGLSLADFQKNLQETFLNGFEAWNDEIQKSIDKLTSYNEVLVSYRDIVDLIGKDQLGISDDILSNMSQYAIQNAIAATSVARQKVESDKQTLESYQKQYESIKDSLTEEDKKLWEETIETMSQSVLEAETEFISTLSTGLQTATDEFTRATDLIIKNFEKAMSGIYGSFEALSNAYDQYSKTNERYLEDYAKIYELSKLNRQITQSINEKDSVKAKEKLRDIQEELNALQNSNAQVTKFEVDELRARYELRLAEIALEEAQNAKNQVRMQRDASGNWSYVYTANQDAINTAQQAYEDKLYGYQNLVQKRISELESQIINLPKEYAEAIRAIEEDRSLSDKERAKRIEETVKYYNEQQKFLTEQLEVTVNRSKELYENDWRNYSAATDYKISTDIKWKDEFGETANSILGGYDSIQEMQDAYIENTEKMIDELNNNYKKWQEDLNNILGEAGTSITGFGDTISGTIISLGEKTVELDQEVSEIVSNMQTAMGQAAETTGALSALYSGYIDTTTKAGETLVEFVNDAQKFYSGFVGNNDILAQSFKNIADQAAGATQQILKMLQALASSPKGEILEDYEKVYVYDNFTEDKNGIQASGEKIKISTLISKYGARIQGYEAGEDYYTLYLSGGEKILVNGGQEGFNIISTLIANGLGFGKIDLQKWITGGYDSFDTGGYTGAWDSSGRIAMLHQKEIVLNAKDTENFLAAVNIVREVARSVDLNAMIQANGFGILSAASAIPTSQALEQEVTIHAEFPNATNHSEIEEAFDTLLNRASQFANRKN